MLTTLMKSIVNTNYQYFCDNTFQYSLLSENMFSSADAVP